MLFAAEVWLIITSFLDQVQANNSIRPAYNEALDNGTYGPYPVKTFMSEDTFASPRVNFVQWSPECDDGMYYFITPRGQSLPDPSPMIIDTNGELVWTQFFDNPFGGQVYDFQVQRYQGEDYLTLWTGDDSVRGHGAGVYYMLNSSYDVVHEIRASDGYSADLHEFTITDQGTALMTIYDKTWHNLTGFREFNATENPDDEFPNYIWDCLVQEISIHTGKVLFQWRTSEHINITDTFREINDGGTEEVPWDWFHVNSIYKDELGNYLISARFTHSITYIDGKTSEVLWVLGGKRNEFMDLSHGDVLNFAWQHDAEFHSVHAFPEIYTPKEDRPGFTTRLMTVFDNAAADMVYDYGADHSRGLLLEVTYPTHRAGNASDRWTDGVKQGLFSRDAKDEEKLYFINGTDPEFTVRLIKSYGNPRKVRSSSQGSMQVLPGEAARTKMFVGYGNNAVFTEFDINGTALCDVHFSAQTAWEQSFVQSYRAFKFPWIGRPTWAPRMEISDDDLEVYLSWNGATEVTEWLLQGSDIDDEFDGEHWADIARFEKRGFETSTELPRSKPAERRYLRALALDKDGQVLQFGTTDILDRESGSDFEDLEVNLPKQIIENHPARSYILLMLGIFLTICGYDLLKRGFSWYSGPSLAGPIRWKKGSKYVRLRNEV